MAFHSTRTRPDQRRVLPVVAAVAALLVVAVLGIIALTANRNSPPARLATAAWSAPASAVIPARTGAEPAATPGATAAVSQARDFDYFPDHYQNRATKVEEPTPTF